MKIIRMTLVALLLCCFGMDAHAADSWEGVWGAERDFGPVLSGPVSLQQDGESWWAEIKGQIVPASRRVKPDGSIAWSFEVGDDGRFEGKQAAVMQPIIGYWFQPPGQVLNFPIATSTTLERRNASQFGGVIDPKRQSIRQFIRMTKDAEGGYRAFLRNPELNAGVRLRIAQAVAKNGEIDFRDADGESLISARIIEEHERFAIDIGRFGATFEFTRKAPPESLGFHARAPSASSSLRRPVQIDDGWQTMSLRQAGLTEDGLKAYVQSIARREPTSVRDSYVHSFLLAYKGKLVIEEYFHGYDRLTTHDSRSAGKSLGTTLIGLAIDRGAIRDVDQAALEFFPDRAHASPGSTGSDSTIDPRWRALTLRHLASMSSGNEGRLQDSSGDWYEYTLDLSMVRDPGEKGIYCTAGINLLGGALEKATGRPVLEFLQDSFARPLNFGRYHVNLMPDNRAYMGGGIRLLPRDFLKMGQIFADDGMWNGRRIISSDWINDAFTAHASVNKEDDYGLGWWRETYTVGNRTVRAYHASGNGGQLLFVVPELELVALFHGGNYSDFRTWIRIRDEVMPHVVLAAVLHDSQQQLGHRN